MKQSCLVLLVLCFAVAPVRGGPAAQMAYLEGLEAMENGRWADATSALTKALADEEENPALYIARGVSNVLGEKFPQALTDFDRALRLDPGNRHARLWKSAMTNMQGNFMAGSEIYPQATSDQYENQIQDMARLYGEYNFRKRNGEEAQYLRPLEADQVKARNSFPQIAKLFASRVKGSTSDISPLLVDRAAQRMAAKDFAAAMKDLQQAASAKPNDMRIAQLRAVCDLYLGAPSAAREGFVRVLTADASNAEAWAGHAAACTLLGDDRRATASAENAASINASIAQRFADLSAKSSAPSKDASARAALDQLYKLATANSSPPDLNKQAALVLAAGNVGRLRADETYLDQRLRLLAATQKTPQSADALADLGEFLYTQAVTIRGEAVEPRAPFATYRPQTDQSQQQELASAQQALDAALRLNPKNVKALTFKAACLIFKLQWGDAETVLKSALAVDPSYGPLLETFARVMDHAAGMKAVAASNLRTVKTWEDAYYYYYRSPSQAELAQADAYDRQAQALWALAERHLEAAAATYAGKPLGFYYAGVLAKRRGNAAEARAAFEKCVALTPDNAAAWDALTDLYYKADMKLEAAAAKSAAANLQHTTAGHFLRYAWGQIARTAYKSAAEALEKAMTADATDPRNCAYMATVAAGRGDVPAALAWWRSAAALEAANAELNGVSFVSQPFETITAAAAGRAMAINLRLGQIALDQKQPTIAAGAFNANVAIANRLAKLDRFSPLPTSQLPDMQTDPNIIPEADTALSLLARSQLGLGRSLLQQNRVEEAFAQFNGLYDLSAQIPPTINPGNMLGDPQVLAKIEMLKVLIDRKQYQQAQQVGRSGNRSGGASRENVNELNQLIREVENHLAQERYDQNDREVQQIRQQQQQQIDEVQRERAARDAARRQQNRRGF